MVTRSFAGAARPQVMQAAVAPADEADAKPAEPVALRGVTPNGQASSRQQPEAPSHGRHSIGRATVVRNARRLRRPLR